MRGGRSIRPIVSAGGYTALRMKLKGRADDWLRGKTNGSKSHRLRSADSRRQAVCSRYAPQRRFPARTRRERRNAGADSRPSILSSRLMGSQRRSEVTTRRSHRKRTSRSGTTIAVINRVPGIVESLGLPKDVVFVKPAAARLVFLFVRTRTELEAKMPPAVAALSDRLRDLGVLPQGFPECRPGHEPRHRLGRRGEARSASSGSRWRRRDVVRIPAPALVRLQIFHSRRASGRAGSSADAMRSTPS